LISAWTLALAALALGLALAGPPAAAQSGGQTFRTALDREDPQDVDDLKALQRQAKIVLRKVMGCTVGVRVAGAQGSGVIVSKEGHVLTAGHVSGKPGQKATIILPDGRTLKGKTLGNNGDIDSGMIKITEAGKWPFAPMGVSSVVKKGQWCLALGHPGGYKSGRSPVVRFGRVLDNQKSYLQTDCALVGGDSGGPLFDLKGKVIGIHSRIGKRMSVNLHVPVNTYRYTWDRLVKGEAWGGQEEGRAYLGVKGSSENAECRVAEVISGSPADRAGLREGDVITKFNRHTVSDFDDLKEQISKRKPGDRVRLDIRRGDDSLTVRVTLGALSDD
jgi:serine protease Do